MPPGLVSQRDLCCRFALVLTVLRDSEREFLECPMSFLPGWKEFVALQCQYLDVVACLDLLLLCGSYLSWAVLFLIRNDPYALREQSVL